MTHPYIPMTEDDLEAMLATIGVPDVDGLFTDIPTDYRYPKLDLPPALSELELTNHLRSLAGQNRSTADMVSFLGAGAYEHFIPSVVEAIISRGEFLTAYTPYQPEISQGTLQGAFEFQSVVCELTGMDIANAGMYDVATAMAEACIMACSVRGLKRIAVLDSVHPNVIDTIRTYAEGRDLVVEEMSAQSVQLGDEYACLGVQQPNFFGYFEDLSTLGQMARDSKSLFIVSSEPVSLGMFKPPADYGADIVVGSGQPIGVPLAFGGPSVGLFAFRQELLRKSPGRIVGRTTDSDGRVGYVLTLQTREQHIRRENATSNICTSTQLIALAFTVAVCTLGKQGLRRMAELCYHKAHYAAEQIDRLPEFRVNLERGFFQEFVVRCPVLPSKINSRLLEQGIIGGYDVSSRFINGMLLCISELHTKGDIDQLVESLREVSRG